MSEPTKKEWKIPMEEVVKEMNVIEEKSKVVPLKPPISRSGPTFPVGNQFRGSQAGAMNNRQRPGRAANRGR